MGKTPCRFVDKSQLAHLDISRVEPWGWDLALRALLKRSGVGEQLLPTDGKLERIRLLSHRRTSAQLLPLLQTDGTIGEAYECSTTEQVAVLKEQYGQVVVKAPWSSSGRGVRFDENAAWASNVIARQGSVMVEPYYNKVKDFGMEFESTDQGIPISLPPSRPSVNAWADMYRWTCSILSVSRWLSSSTWATIAGRSAST